MVAVVEIRNQSPTWKMDFKESVLKFMQGYTSTLDDLYKKNSPLVRNKPFDYDMEEYESLLYTVVRMLIDEDAPPTTYYLRHRHLAGYLLEQSIDLLEDLYIYEDIKKYPREFMIVVRHIMKSYTVSRTEKASSVN